MLLQKILEKLRDNTLENFNVDGYNVQGLNDADVRAIVSALQLNTSLKEIVLPVSNSLSSASFQGLAEVLTGHPTLNSFSIYTINSQSFTDSNRQFFLDMVEKTLSIRSCTLGNGFAVGSPSAERLNLFITRNQRIADQLGRIESDRSLSLFNTNQKIVSSVAKFLKDQSSLLYLYFARNYMGDEGAVELAEALMGLPNLVSIDISEKEDIGDKGAQALAALILSCPSLRQIQLGSQRIGDVGAIAFAEALKAREVITQNSFSLGLDNNQIGDVGALVLAEALQAQPRLYLGITRNRIGNIGAIALTQALANNTAIDSWFLDGNLINATGAIAIVKILQNNTRVRLYISDNSLGNEVASALSLSLANNTDIAGLRNISLTESGAMTLAQGLMNRTNGAYVDLSDNLIGNQGARALLSAMQYNPAVQVSLYNAGTSGISNQTLFDEIRDWQNYNGNVYSQVYGRLKTTAYDYSLSSLRDRDFYYLINALKTNSYARSLGSGNVNEAQMLAILDLLTVNQHLSSLTITNNNLISDKMIFALANALKLNTALNTLYLFPVSDAGAVALANALQTREAPFWILNLGGPDIGNAGALAAIEAMKASPTLDVRGVGPNPNISNNNQNILYELSSKNRAFLVLLQQLDQGQDRLSLYMPDINAKQLIMLANILKENTVLSILEIDISESPYYYRGALSSQEVQDMATMLKYNRALSVLRLVNSPIGDAAAVAFSDALLDNSSLHYLHLSNSSLTATGASILGGMLETQRGLKGLSLDSNPLQDAGVIALAKGLADNPTLTSLSLSNTRMTNSGAQALKALITDNPALVYLDLRNNSIDAALLAEIETQLSVNQAYPVFVNNTLKVTQGAAVILSGEQLSALNVNRSDYAPIEFNITALERGQFFNRNNQTVRIFSQTDIDAGQLRFQHDGSTEPPRYAVTARNRLRTSQENPAAILFRALPEVPSTTSKPADSTISNTQATSSSSSLMLTTDKAPTSLSFSNTAVGSSALPSSSVGPATPPLNSTSLMLSTSSTSTTPQITQSLTASGRECLPCPLNNNTESQATVCSSNVGLMIGLGLTSAFGLLAMIAFFLLWMRYTRSHQRVGLTGHPRLSREVTLPMQDNPLRRPWNADDYDINAETAAQPQSNYESVETTYERVDQAAGGAAPALPARATRPLAAGLHSPGNAERVTTLRKWDPEHYDVQGGAPGLSNSRV